MISYKKGFTLIELLVVISIIGLLSSIVLASLSGARIKARNSARNSQVMEYAKALALYKAGNNFFPNPGDIYVCLGGTSGCGDLDNPGIFSQILKDNLSQFIPSYPPIGSGVVSGSLWSGALYFCDNYPDCTIAGIFYWLESNKASCARPANTKSITRALDYYYGDNVTCFIKLE